jgi:dihydroxyacetone kinase
MRELIIRGLAGTILVYKLAAALSEQGADLDKVEAVAKYATTRLGTLGIGLDHCHVRPPLPCARGKTDD